MSIESFKFKSASKLSTDNDSVQECLQSIVSTLAAALERCLTPKQFERIEGMFSDSDSLSEILHSISKMATMISEHITKRESASTKIQSPQFQAQIENHEHTNEENYLNLEKMVQKYEKEIRDHIRMEQQLNIYAQSLEEELDGLKLSYVSKSVVDDLEKQLGNSKREVERLRAEKTNLEQLIKNNAKSEVFNSHKNIRAKNKSIDNVI